MLLNLFQKVSKLILWGITLIPKSDKEITHAHTNTHKHTQRKLQAYASWSILESFQTPSVRHHTDTKIRHRNQTHTHTHTQNWRPKSLINIEHTKWSGLRHQLLLRACFPMVAQMGLVCLSLDLGRKEAKNSLWLLALFLHLGRSKGNWTDHKAFRGLFEALRICNPRRSRPLNLFTSSAGGTLRARGPNPTFFFPLPSSRSLTTSPERKGLQIPNFSIPHRLAEY